MTALRWLLRSRQDCQRRQDVRANAHTYDSLRRKDMSILPTARSAFADIRGFDERLSGYKHDRFSPRPRSGPRTPIGARPSRRRKLASDRRLLLRTPMAAWKCHSRFAGRQDRPLGSPPERIDPCMRFCTISTVPHQTIRLPLPQCDELMITGCAISPQCVERHAGHS